MVFWRALNAAQAASRAWPAQQARDDTNEGQWTEAAGSRDAWSRWIDLGTHPRIRTRKPNALFCPSRNVAVAACRASPRGVDCRPALCRLCTYRSSFFLRQRYRKSLTTSLSFILAPRRLDAAAIAAFCLGSCQGRRIKC